MWWGCLASRVIALLLVVFFALLLVAFFVFRPSALDALHRFAQMPPDSSFNREAVRAAFLQRLPIGTPESEVYEYINQAGAELGPNAIRDGRKQIRCNPSGPSETSGYSIPCFVRAGVLESGPLCDKVYMVIFIEDPSTKKVIDIRVGYYSACL